MGDSPCDMTLCPRCDGEVPPDDESCPDCGAPIQRA